MKQTLQKIDRAATRLDNAIVSTFVGVARPAERRRPGLYILRYTGLTNTHLVRHNMQVWREKIKMTRKAARRARTFDRVELPDVGEDAPVFEGTDVPVQYLFDYMGRIQNLYAFLMDFPEVRMEDALRSMRQRVRAEMPVHSDRGRVSGMPVFKGSRVPMRDLFGQLAEGVTLEEYLLDFPTAGREQVIKTIEMAGMLMEVMAYENSIG